jgi:hypothetical protein
MKCEGKNVTKNEQGVVLCCDSRREDGCEHLVVLSVDNLHMYLCKRPK